MKVYRIYTEDKNFNKVVTETNNRMNGATFFRGVGIYKGDCEKSLLIEIVNRDISDREMHDKVMALAYAIRCLNWQWYVLVTAQEVQSWVI